jgi:translation initiation factor IF-2
MRRHLSRDDAIPDVRPSFVHDPRQMLARGGGASRGGLTAAQLRQRESGRFLRRNRPGGPGRRGGRGDGRESAGPLIDPGTSPYKGGTVQVEAPLTVKNLAEALSVKSHKVLHTAFKQLGFGAVNINSLLDEDTAILLAHEFEVELELLENIAVEQALLTELEEKRASVGEDDLCSRPPTVAFLGHVDHGKTTLIDCIRDSQVAKGEAGGITQHIGAYQVITKHNHPLTVIDTPGHAAFTAMRARGAQAVDVVVLVVAGDDGVQQHTEEALNHAKAAGTPVVVAVTKMDKPEANSQRIKEQLAGLDLIPEDWGGHTAMMEVSGIKGTGVQELLERVYLESDVLELHCHPTGPASGVVLEAEVQQGKGIVAHLLVQDGCLKRGDVILAGEGYGKVRSIHDDRGNIIEEASPSTPVEVSGLSALPGVGAAFHVVDDLARAKEVAEERERQNRASSLTGRRTVTAASLMEAVSTARTTINLIVRADVQGSVEVLRHAIEELIHEEVEVRVLHAGVGAITESDVLLGSTSGALLVAFNVGVNDKARVAAEREDLDIRHYSVIYEILDDLRAMMEGSLAPAITEETTGHVEIRRLFKSSKLGLIAGCVVLDGIIKRSERCRVLRDGTVVHEGSISSLRRESDDAKEVREGFECGIVLKNYRDIKEGDIIETFKTVETKRTLG